MSARGFIINKLISHPLAKSTSAVLYLAENDLEIKKMILILKYWQKIFANQFTILEFNSENPAWFNLKLNNQPHILLATKDNLNTAWFDMKKITEEKITLQISEEINLIKFKKQLINIGLENNKNCQAPGEFSIQGNIISLWLNSYSQILKIELEGKKIVQMFYFNPVNKKREEIKQFHLTNQLNKHCRSTAWRENFDIIFNTDNSNKTLPQKGMKITISAWTKNNDFDFGIETIPEKSPASWLEKKIKNIKPQIVLTDLKLNNTLFPTAKIKQIPSFIYLKSWHWPKGEALVFTYTTEEKPLTSQRKQQLFFNKIKPGDLLVHQDHGLCRFAKITKQAIDGHLNEYLELHFAGQDKLFLPPHQIAKVSKYIGQTNPPLNKLSGSNWLKIIKKIREETIQLAQDIIYIQAQRTLNNATPLKKLPAENALAAEFPYNLTPDQIKAWSEIETDLEKDSPMDRLLCGDVAFGKTELALRAAFKSFLNNGQSALLAPTTILVQQHYDFFCARLKHLGVKIAVLSRWQENKEQNEILNKLKQGKIDIIIGTHRLLSSDVSIPKLKLLIIDEEQKFGVKDKEKIKKRKPNIHTLTLSATPIPRTLNYSLSGLKDISLIQTPPSGRKPIKTYILPHTDNIIKKSLKFEFDRGGQVYYLVRKIKEIPSIQEMLEKLSPSKAKIGVAHGQLQPRELAKIMQAFDQKEIDILICSTIIENGLDLPNVNTLIVDNAAHFGLAQLYQLRGRIGRGPRQAYAYFLFRRQKLTGLAEKRLEALKNSYELGSGFEIALKDLEIRGAGNLLGKEQHGEISAIGLNLYTELLEQSINYLKNGKIKTHLDVIIDLPIPNSLTDKDIPDTSQRLAIYQELSFCRNEKELISAADKILGEKKSEREKNLLNIIHLKILGSQAGIFEIQGKVLSRAPFLAKLTLHLTPEHNYKKILKLLKKNDAWQYEGNKLSIKTNELKNPDWLEELVKNIKILAK